MPRKTRKDCTSLGAGCHGSRGSDRIAPSGQDMAHRQAGRDAHCRDIRGPLTEDPDIATECHRPSPIRVAATHQKPSHRPRPSMAERAHGVCAP